MDYAFYDKFIYFVLFTVDQIYHLASPASPPNYMYNPVKTIKTNTIGTNNMLGKFWLVTRQIQYIETNNMLGKFWLVTRFDLIYCV